MSVDRRIFIGGLAVRFPEDVWGWDWVRRCGCREGNIHRRTSRISWALEFLEEVYLYSYMRVGLYEDGIG